jgi:dihydroxyacetone kinase-like protein
MNSVASVSQEVITVADLTFAIGRVAEAMDIAAAELNAADGALGDGDIGITVSRGFAEAAAAEFPQDFGGALVACAKAFQRVSSSSYGTLLATAFLAAAKQCTGRSSIEAVEISQIVDAALTAMMARGRGELGDKTVLDILKAVVDATAGSPGAHLYDNSLAAARSTLEDFKSKPNKLGRARMFGAASIGLYDPGQLAMVRIIEALRPVDRN